MQDRFKILRSAEKYLANRQYDKAIEAYQKLIRSGGDDPGLLNTLGDLLLKNDRKQEALSVFQKVADIFVESGFVAKAVAVCKKIHRIAPEDDSLTEKVVDLYRRRGVTFEAVAFLRQVIDKCEENGEWARAVRWQERIVKLDEGEPHAHRQLAELFLKSGNRLDAIEHFLIAGRLFREKKSDSASLECIQEVLNLEPGNAEARRIRESIERISRTSSAAKSPGGGVSQADRPSVGMTPKQKPEFDLNGLGGSPAGGVAEDDFEQFDEIELKDVGGPMTASQASQTTPSKSEEGSSSQAGDALESASLHQELPKGFGEIDELGERLQEVEFYSKLDLHDEARQIVTDLLDRYPEDERVLKRAEEFGLAPRSPKNDSASDAGFDSEVEFALDGLFDESVSEEVAEEPLTYQPPTPDRGDPNSPSSRYDLGLAYREMGMFQDAVEKFEEAFKLAQKSGDSDRCILCASMLCSTHLQLHNGRKAVEWAERGLEFPVEKGIEWKSLQFDRARALEMMGNNSESLKVYRTIFESDPEFKDVQARIARLDLPSS